MKWQDAQISSCTPGTDLAWLSAISRYLLDNGVADTKFLDQWANGLAEYRKSLEPFTMEAAARISGVPEETLKTVAQMISEAERMCILWAMGLTQRDVSDRRGNEHRGLQCQLCRRRIRQARVLCRAGHFFQQHLPLCRCCAARSTESGKGRHLHQYREAHPATLPSS